jgi:DNA transformation protein and related proteins
MTQGTKMPTDREFLNFVCDQLRGGGEISFRRMFGEAAIYLNGKVVGLVCDNQLFVKATEAGRARIGRPTEAAPFPGASPWFLMTDLDDVEFLAELVRVTADALPVPQVKANKPRRSSSRPAGRKVITKSPRRRS